MSTKLAQRDRVGFVKFTLNYRTDGRTEAVCEHGVGHTVTAPKGSGKEGFVHGCDGCCGTKEFKEYAENVRSMDRPALKAR